VKSEWSSGPDCAKIRATMMPDASTHNPSPEYCRDLIDSTGMTRPVLAKKLGMDERTLRRYLSGERKFPYPIQFMLECIVLEP